MFYRSSHLLLEITFSFHGDGAEHLELASQNISTVNCDCFLGAIGKDHKLTRYTTTTTYLTGRRPASTASTALHSISP